MMAQLEAFCRLRPRAAIWLAGLAGMIISCYPVVFCGRSFVSPNLTIPLLYNHLPTLPGYDDPLPGDRQGSDVTATMVQSVPWAITQREAIFRDHELPLWNRYDAGGVPLLGQGLSMIGDPLQWLPIVTNSAAWAWDLKFLLAKLLFAAGVGFAVLTTARHLPSALLMTFSSCFISFFIYRLNHPAFFSVCFAPWILFAWFALAHGNSPRLTGLLLFANWCELNSGTAKEASVLLISLNACGVLNLILEGRSVRRNLGILTIAGIGFAMVSAPVWLTFYESLSHSWNDYQKPAVWQMRPGLAIGFFDDVFYRPFNHGWVLNPGVNFVALIGLALAIASWKTLRGEYSLLALILSAILPAAIVFGVVPARWLIATPFLGHIVHVDTVFSAPLIILTLVAAAYGWRAGWRVAGRWQLHLVITLGALIALLVVYPGSVRDLWRYTTPLVVGVVSLTLAWRLLSLRSPVALPFLTIGLGLLLWRHGLQAWPAEYVMSPGPRVHLLTPSPAVEAIREQQELEPGRTMGFDDCLAPGFAAVYRLQSPSGPDALQNTFYHQLLQQSGIEYRYRWNLVADREAFARQRKFFDVLNVRYYLGAPGNVPAGLERIAQKDLDVLVSTTAWPRAFFTDSVATYQEPFGFYQQVATGDGRPFASVAGGGLIDLPHDLTSRRWAAANDYHFTNHTTTFRVHASGPGVIVLLESDQADDVRIVLNGVAVPHFRVDAAFSGIRVPAAGDYQVTFDYWPQYLTASLWVALSGALLLAGGWFTWRATRDREQSAQTPARAPLDLGGAAVPMDAP